MNELGIIREGAITPVVNLSNIQALLCWLCDDSEEIGEQTEENITAVNADNQ